MIARIFANALARRLAAVIVAGVLAWVGIGSARSQNASDCLTSKYTAAFYCNTKADAIAGVKMGAEGRIAASCSGAGSYGVIGYIDSGGYNNGVRVITARLRVTCVSGAVGDVNRVFPKADLCPAGQEWNDVRGGCQSPCSGRAQSLVKFQQMIPDGSYSCVDGCEARIAPAADGEYFQTFVGGTSSHCNALPSDCSKFGAGYGMNYGTSMCQPPFVECQENEVKDPISGTCTQGCELGMLMDANGVCKPKEDQCPPGNVKSPAGGCLPGDGQCAIGEVKGKDGTCKRDADGDGKPDEGEEEGTTDPTFSGGDSCDAPPACSGSPILCGQARIQWRIDCNTRRDRQITGGACSNVPLCVGKNCDALEYASLLQQWKASCALEKLATKSGDDGDTGQPEWTKVGGMNQNPGAGELASDRPTVGEKTFNVDDLDSSGFGGGSCIGMAVTSGSGAVGSSYAQEFAAPPAAWCNFIANLRASLIIMASAIACFIIAKGF